MQTSPHSQNEATTLSGKRVVIVEDEAITQLQLQKMLRKAGLLVVGSAPSGEEGIATVLQERPDLVLMDVNMPGAINGLEAARRILADYRVCIVIVTAYVDHQEEAEELGACGYIIKPVDSMSLVPQLQRAFEQFYRI